MGSLEQYLVDNGYIPLSKSWIIRMGVLDILNGYDDINKFLDKQDKKQLNDDLKSLRRAVYDWHNNMKVYVGESRTLLIFLQYASWKYSFEKEFIKEGTLLGRKMWSNPDIVNWPLERLVDMYNAGDLDTSQWISASVIFNDPKKVETDIYHVNMSYEAVDHWKQQRANNKVWLPRGDRTIAKQAVAFIESLRKGTADFIIEQPEDYCFARVLGKITKEEAKLKWHTLKGHESDRFEEMEKVIYQVENNIAVDSKDHRVVQAAVMYGRMKDMPVKVLYPEAVNKSWPQFWMFVEDSGRLKDSIQKD